MRNAKITSVTALKHVNLSKAMTDVPSENALISAKAFLRDGYPFIQKGTERHQSDIFQINFLGMKTTCIHGKEAARIFYDQEKFIRKGAIPKRVQKTLLGENGIHSMDDASHRHRKAMFLSIMTPENSIQELMDLMARYWRAYVGKWEKMPKIILFHDVQEILCLAACAWAGIPLKPTEVRERARDYWAMVDAFGAVGPRHWRGRWARRKTEKWIGGIIQQVRKEKLQVAPGTPAYEVAWHRGIDGKLLSTNMAAIELINATRPIVAIAAYVSFAALALHEHPALRQKVREGGDAYAEMFVHEVRRFYPFAPFLGAIVRSDFDWNGHRFKRGRLVLLDVYGTLHDEQLWENAGEFDPERFREWNGSRFDLIPQGGGEHGTGHRCPGERITIEGTKLALKFLVNCMDYTVPEQDLSFSLTRLPTYPKSGFIITGVKRTGDYVPTPVASTADISMCPFHSKP